MFGFGGFVDLDDGIPLLAALGAFYDYCRVVGTNSCVLMLMYLIFLLVQARLVCIPVRWSVLRPFVPRQQHLASIVSNRAPKGITKVIAHIVIEFRYK